jgi:hypothetical protein
VALEPETEETRKLRLVLDNDDDDAPPAGGS